MIPGICGSVEEDKHLSGMGCGKGICRCTWLLERCVPGAGHGRSRGFSIGGVLLVLVHVVS